MINLCFWAFILFPNLSFAHEPEFRLRTRYDDNDYSAEDRDVIEGFRMSFVPPKWDGIVINRKRIQKCSKLAEAFISQDYESQTEEAEDLVTVVTTTIKPVDCTGLENQYEDNEEQEDYNLDTSTDKTTKTDYFVMGILQRGKQICGMITSTTSATSIDSEKSVSLQDEQTLAEYEYDDDEVSETTFDATCENTSLEPTTEVVAAVPSTLHCRQEESGKAKSLVTKLESSHSQLSKETTQTYVPIPSLHIKLTKSTVETTKLGTVTSTDVPVERIPYSSCVINEINLDRHSDDLPLPGKESYTAFVLTDNPDETYAVQAEKMADATKEINLLRDRHAKEKRLARERRTRKPVQKERWDKDKSILNYGIIDDHVAFEGDLNIPYSDQFMHMSTINISKVPTESDEDILAKSMSLKQRVHESFWLQNEEMAHVREIHARNMKKYIDFNVDPCQDFFQYACGNWYKFNPIPNDRNNYDTFDLLRESLDYILKDILQDKSIDRGVNVGDKVWKGLHPVYRTKARRQSDYDADDYYFLRNRDNQPSYRSSASSSYGENTMEATKKAKYLFSSCMNTELLQKRGVHPALDLIATLGGWPILDANWQPNGYEFEWLLAQLRLYNNDILLSEWVGPDIRNSKEYIIQIDQTTLGLPSREYYLEPGNEDILIAYQKYIVAIAMGMGANESTVERDALDIISFEIDLASITVANDEPRNVSDIYIRLSINELQQLIPQFNWGRYFRLVSDNYVEADDAVVLYCMQYIRSMIELISHTNVRTTTNYLLWRFMRHRVNNLDDRFQVAKQRFYKIVFGRDNQPPRWQSCVMQVNSNMGMAVGKLFVSKYYTKQSKDDTLHMTKYIREAFADILRDTTWLDPITTDLAIIKLAAMRLKIGYPNYILNRRKLNRRYSDLQVHPGYYFENTLSILQHLTRLEHYKLKRQVDKNVWNSAPAVVNAYYSRNKNQIIFPAGILQPPFYHRHFPKSMNFGGIGIVMGHEMTHGFDDKGRLFDKEGNLKNWWKDESIEEFHERTQCLIEQYNHYLIPEANMQLDGESTQGENIADNGGLKQAFLAYQYWLKDNENKLKSETLPGLNLTNLQLFFLNFAQIWCGDMRAEAAITKLPGALHSPGRFRVIGSVSNSEEFAAVFNCPVPAPMNPDDKCTIW